MGTSSKSRHLQANMLTERIGNTPGLDVHGKRPDPYAFPDYMCSNCDRKIAVTRYAPHLEKCLGLGRTSGRLKNKRHEGMMAAHTCLLVIQADADTKLMSIQVELCAKFALRGE